MATTNLNKIVRGNINFKPWIAAKNTTEIVNSYVQRFYKQIPDNFKSDLLNPRSCAPKTENRVPIRKVVPEKFNIPIISNKPISKLRSNGYRSPAITTKNSFITAPKKFLKTPNFKIYTNRRYASSVSSSKSSFVGIKSNKNEEYRRNIYKPVQRTQTFRGAEAFLPNAYYYNNSPKAVDVSKAVCNDLMSIDDVLKKKICPMKKKLPSLEPLQAPKQDLWELSSKGWNQPSIEHYRKLTTAPVFKKPEKRNNGSFLSEISSFRLMPVKRKLYTRKTFHSGPAPKKENTRLQSLGSSYYKRLNIMPPETLTTESDRHQFFGFDTHGRVSARFNGLRNAVVPSKEKQQYSCNLKNALDFVCLTRAERSERNRIQRGFQGNLRF